MQISITNNTKRLKLNTTERRALQKAAEILDGIRIVYPEATLEDVLACVDKDGVMAPILKEKE